MKYCLQHGIGDPNSVPEMIDQPVLASWARAVEESGWSGIAFTDHPAPSGKWARAGGEGSSDLFTSLAFCAALTDHVNLVTLVTVLPFRSPFVTLHQVRTLDRLSAGRLVVGVGTGYLRGEFRALGVDFERRRELFDEALDILTLDPAVEEYAGSGAGFSTSGTIIRPPSVQRPHPPVWVHANSPWGVERAARAGNGILLTLTTEELAATIRSGHLPGPAEVRDRIEGLRRAAEAHGRDPGELVVGLGGVTPSMLDIRTGWDTDRVLEDVAGYAALGVDWMMCTVAGDDPAASEETTRAFGEQVVRAG
jgi:probable F420-dependent oxidoreductase